VILTAAVSVPLWYLSEKIWFNDDYRAAKSEILQHWLTDNQLTLKEVEIQEESRTVIFDFEGPNPPINIGELHERLEANAETQSDDESDMPLKIKYTWSQKITGNWPSEGNTIQEIAQKVELSSKEITSHQWAWKLTQYNDNKSTEPSSQDPFTLSFESSHKFRVSAECGSWTGKFTLGNSFLGFEMNKNYFSGCRKDQNLEIFLNDLRRARTGFIEDDTLRITLAGSEGVIYFERK
jgi:heat shock protein HslJ